MTQIDFDQENYPWYVRVKGDEIKQGDIIEKCKVFIPPNELADSGDLAESYSFDWEERDVIIMSQSCDMVKGREKITEILLCAIWRRSELAKLNGNLTSDAKMEEIRKGRMPNLHLLNSFSLGGNDPDFFLVDFARIYSLPIDYMRRKAAESERIRLLPPYREHLSQSFARFFMRVGLPTDIPSFRKRS